MCCFNINITKIFSVANSYIIFIWVSNIGVIYDNIVIKKGAELGRFLLGSTVVCVFPKGKVKFDKAIKPELKVKVNQALANM